MLANKGKKFLAMLLTFCMVLGLLPMSAFAADESNNITRQGEALYFDAEGNAVPSGDEAVSIEKNIAATGVENEYNITLNVNVKDQIIPGQVVGADVVLVLDVSGSMDSDTTTDAQGNTVKRWVALKEAADSFIHTLLADSNNRLAIVVYGTDEAAVRYPDNSYWTNREDIAKAAINKTNRQGTPSASAMRNAYGVSNSGTNCQGGFRGAQERLTTAGGARANSLPYVVYMSDGEANYYYCKDIGGIFGWGHDYDPAMTGGDLRSSDSLSPGAAVQQAQYLKTQFPNAKLFTVGIGTSTNNKVLSKAGNSAVDEAYNSNDANLIHIYGQISDQITLETKPWTVYDPMSGYVDMVSSSVDGKEFVSIDLSGRRIVWDLNNLAQQHPEQKSFSLTYTVRLKDDDALWADGATHPTNDTTKLVYKITETEGDSTTTHDAVSVNFDVPEVKATLYTVTIEHYIDNERVKSDSFTHLASYNIDLNAQILSRSGVTYLGRVVGGESLDDVDVYTVNAEHNGTTLRYDYKTGYPLTINYVDEDGASLAAPHQGAYKNNEAYSVSSAVIPGWSLKDPSQETITGTMTPAGYTVDVVYTRDEYTVTYAYEGTAPTGVSVPSAQGGYHYDDAVTLADAPSATGWTFLGWDHDDGFQIKGNTTVTGTWAINQYDLDVIYKFAADDDANAFLDAMYKAGTNAANALIREPGESDEDFAIRQAEAAEAAQTDYAESRGLGSFVTVYDAADGNTYYNVFVAREAEAHDYSYAYDVNALTAENFKTSPENHKGTLGDGDKTLVFTLFNDLYTVTVNHYKENKDGGYVLADTEYLYVNSGEGYTVKANSYTGFDLANPGVATDYTMGNDDAQDITYDLYYDAQKFDAVFHFTTDSTPAGIALPDTQENLWYGEQAAEPDGMSSAGWNFDGWYTDEALTTKYNFTTPVTGNLDLYGAWTIHTYTVKFVHTPAANLPNGVNNPSSQSGIPYRDTATEPDAPVYEDTDQFDYNFLGWFQDTQGKTSFDFSTPITKDLTVYGVWTKHTQSYGYSVEHYLDGAETPFTITTPTPSVLNYGTIITDEAAKDYQLGTDELKNVNDGFVTFAAATGVTIGADSADNVIKCYYTTNTYTLTIHYVYQDQSVAAPDFTSTVVYKDSFNVANPSVTHYHVEKAESQDVPLTGDLSAVAGVMPGRNAAVTVTYKDDPKASLTINYLDKATETPIEGVDPYISNFYVGGPYSVIDEYTTGKSITNYTYDSMSGAPNGNSMPNTGVTVNVYFTRDTYAVTIKHVDEAGNDIVPPSAPISYNVGDNNFSKGSPLSELTGAYQDYKLASSEPAVSGITDVGGVPSKDDRIVVTYSYVPKNAVTADLRFWLVKDGEADIRLNPDYVPRSYLEGESYDLTDAIAAFIAAHPEYTHQRTTGDATSGTITANQGNVIVDVYFNLTTFTLTTGAINATIDEGFTYSYDAVGMIRVAFRSENDYHITTVTVDGANLSGEALNAAIASGSVTVDRLGNHNVQVAAARNPHDVSYIWGDVYPHSATLPKGQTGIPYGDELTVDSDYFNGKTLRDIDPGTGAPGTYTFHGWDKSGTIEIFENTVITGSWTFAADTYTVTFLDHNDSVLQKNELVAYHASVTEATPPAAWQDAQYTYTFAYWEPQGSYSLNDLKQVAKDMVFKATYDAALRAYGVTYAWTGDIPTGAALPPGATQDYGTEYTVNTTYTQWEGAGRKDNVPGIYTFSGWSPAGINGKVTIQGDLHFSGAWTFTPNGMYPVSYRVDGDAPTAFTPAIPGSENHYATDSVTVAQGLTTDSHSKGGLKGTWTFNGWKLDHADVTGKTFSMPNAAVKLTGSWTFTEYAKYDVTYEVTGAAPQDSTVPAPASYYATDSVTVAHDLTSGETSYNGMQGRWVFDGWKRDGISVSGTTFSMPSSAVKLIGTWSFVEDSKYTVTVNYLLQGTATSLIDAKVSSPSYVGSAYNASGNILAEFSTGGKEYVRAGELTGSPVQGILDSNKVINAFYAEKSTFTVTVNYYHLSNEDGHVYGDSDKLLPSLTAYNGYSGKTYVISNDLVSGKAVDHYTFVTADGDALTGALDGDKVINTYFRLNDYQFSVKYFDDYRNVELIPGENDHIVTTGYAAYGTLLNEELAGLCLENPDWLNAMRPSGYNMGVATYVTVVDDAAKNIVEVHYDYSEPSNPSTPSYFHVTVKYLEKGTSKALAAQYRTDSIRSGRTYDVSEQVAKVLPGYTIDSVDGETSGTLRRNLTVTVWYIANGGDIEIPEEEVPLAPNPGNTPEQPSDVDIPEEEVPLAPAPEGEGSGETIIVDGDVPLGNLPQTGTAVQAVEPRWTLGTLALMASMAVAGLAITISRKKEEDAE